MKDIIDKEFGVIDFTGLIVACSDVAREGGQMELAFSKFTNEEEPIIANGFTFLPIGKGSSVEHIVFVSGEDAEAKKNCLLLTISFANIKKYYNEKYDKDNFIKNILLDNVLPGDVFIKAKEFHLNPNVKKVVFVIRTYENNNLSVRDIIQNMFPEKDKEFVIVIDDRNIALVKELKEDYEPKYIEKIAKTIMDTLNTEVLMKSLIGIGSVVDSINQLGKSYKEAQIALEVGKVFDTEKFIMNYENLGIGRLIYQLPTTLCELFLAEVFKKTINRYIG